MCDVAAELTLLPCFCGNTDPSEFVIKINKISCSKCNTVRVSSTTTSEAEMVALWNRRGDFDVGFAMSKTQQTLMDKYFEKMCSELVSNNHKGDMVTDWNPNAYQLIAETGYHLAKLHKAMLEVERGGIESARSDVDEFAADVGNFMAKTCQTLGTIKLEISEE